MASPHFRAQRHAALLSAERESRAALLNATGAHQSRAALLSAEGARCLAGRAPREPSGGGTLRSLLALAVAAVHRPAVAQLLGRFDAAAFDVWLMHYDGEDEPARRAWWAGLNHSRVSHRWRPGFVKLDFARAELTPAAVCGYEYVLLWDGDATPSDAAFDGGALVRTLRERNVSVAQPALAKGSATSYEFSVRHDGGPPFREAWMVEVGFMVFSLQAWLRVHTLWSAYAFKYWWFDTLPYGCLLAADGGRSRSVIARRASRSPRTPLATASSRRAMRTR